MDELPVTQLHHLLDFLAVALRPHLDRPFGFFGHGAGAHIAFALARRLRRAGAPQPRHLWLSACPAPHLERSQPPLSRLAPDAFVAEALRRGLVDPDTAARPDHLALMLPALAADMAVWESARYEPEPPLRCAISVFGGMQDRTAPWWQLQAWHAQTSGPFRLRLMPGGHWYLRNCPEVMLQLVSEELGC
jgi:medium-chain acyl-[acyl-carrier-protein] hydrolase